MKIVLANSPWYKESNGVKYYFVRAGSRWPHFEQFNNFGKPCYMPYPFFLGYSSSILKQKKFDVTVIDGAAELLAESEFLKRIIAIQPNLVLLEVSSVSIEKDLKDAAEIKQKTGAKIIFAGLNSLMYSPEFLRNNKNVDFVLIGEYEYTLLELCNCLKQNKDLSQIKGLIYRTAEEKIVDTGRRPLIENLDELPFPDRENLKIENYLDTPGNIRTPSVQLTASRGCPFGCIFCAWPQIMYDGKKFRQRSVWSVISELKFLKEKYKINSAYFDDDTFNVNKLFAQELSTKIIDENIDIEWAAMCRADIMDEETLLLMKKAGLKAVKYGVESASPEILKNIDKSLDIDKTVKMIEFTKHNKIKTHLTFCFGLPGETKTTIDETIKLACELSPDSAQFSIATPFPGSRYYNLLKQQNRILTDDFSKYDGYNTCVIAPENVEPSDLEDAVKKAYNQYNHSLKKNIKNKIKTKITNFFITWKNESAGMKKLNAKIKLFFEINIRFIFRYKKYLVHFINGAAAFFILKIFESLMSLSGIFFKFKYSDMTKIKLVFISRESINLPGGRVRCHYFAQALKDKNIDTVVWNYPEIFNGCYDGVNEGKMWDLRRIILNIKFIFKVLKLDAPPVIYMQRMHYHSLGAYLMNKYWNLKYIFDVDDWDFDKRPFFVLSELRLFNCENFTKVLAVNAATIVVSSHYLYDIFKKWNNEIYMVQTVVYRKLFKYIPKTRASKEIIFSWIGTFYRQDNCENIIYLIDLFNELETKYPDVRLEIVGQGPLIDNVLSHIKSENIKYIQWIDPKNIPEYLANIDVGLFPLWQNIEFNLGKSPTKLFEYMALGKISLSSDMGETKHIITDNHNGFIAKNKNEFLKRLEYIINNIDKLDYIGKNAMYDIETKYCLEIQTNEIKNILSGITI